MGIKRLDTVVLDEDVPSHGLKRGDIGAVVEIYGDEALDVEFVTASGLTQAILLLNRNQVRLVGPRDILAVRKPDAA